MIGSEGKPLEISRAPEEAERPTMSLDDIPWDDCYKSAVRVVGARFPGIEPADIVQSAASVLVENPPHLDGDPTKYMTGTAYNIARDALRSRVRRKTVPSATNDEVQGSERHWAGAQTPLDPETAAVGSALMEDINNVLSRLKPEHREILEQRLHGLSDEEIAKRLSIPIGTVASRINRARQRARQLIGDGWLDKQG